MVRFSFNAQEPFKPNKYYKIAANGLANEIHVRISCSRLILLYYVCSRLCVSYFCRVITFSKLSVMTSGPITVVNQHILLALYIQY